MKVKITHHLWKHKTSNEEQIILDGIINDLLEPLQIDCIAYNAGVNAIITEDGNYKIEPHCDQYSTLLKMQELLPELIPAFT